MGRDGGMEQPVDAFSRLFPQGMDQKKPPLSTKDSFFCLSCIVPGDSPMIRGGGRIYFVVNPCSPTGEQNCLDVMGKNYYLATCVISFPCIQ